MPCIYVLKSLTTNKRYIGSSRQNDPIKRLNAHNKGTTKSTKKDKPWIVIYTEEYPTYTEARKRELFLKSGQGRKWLDENLK